MKIYTLVPCWGFGQRGKRMVSWVELLIYNYVTAHN